MSGIEIPTIAAIVTAATAVGGLGYTLAQGKPGIPDISTPNLPAPPAPSAPPPAAPDTSIDTEEQKARQRAVQRIRDLAQRQSAPSTVLSAPLGISAPGSTSATTALLGR